MAAKKEQKPTVKWVIDVYGILAVLRTSKNSIRAAVFDAIESGEMVIIRSVSKEIKDAYEYEYDSFKSIKGKKYIPATVKIMAAAGSLTERFGANIFGSVPASYHFQSVAIAMTERATLVSDGKAKDNCKKIVKKCGLNPVSVIDINEFPLI